MLVIFDCDGVLVDSERLAAGVFSDTLGEQGILLSAEQCYTQFHGRTLVYCFEWLERVFKCRLPNDFEQTLSRATRACFQDSLQPVEGVVDILEWLQKRNIECCVASNGEHEKIAHSLEVTGLDRFFPERFASNCRRFSREDVTCGKPSPELFLYAAEIIGVPPAFCTVVEDSAAGFNAAEAAGMRLLCYTSEKEESGRTTFQSMKELKHIL